MMSWNPLEMLWFYSAMKNATVTSRESMELEITGSGDISCTVRDRCDVCGIYMPVFIRHKVREEI